MSIKKIMLSLSLLVAAQSAAAVSLPSKAGITSKIPSWQQAKQFAYSLPEKKSARVAFYATEAALGTGFGFMGTVVTIPTILKGDIKEFLLSSGATGCTYFNMFHGYRGLSKELEPKKNLKILFKNFLKTAQNMLD